MRNILLSFIMLFNNAYLNNEMCKVDKIEWNMKDCENDCVFLNIKITSIVRDVVQLTIYFYDEEKELLNNKYYSSSLVIEGTKQTTAKIPIKVQQKIYLNIVVYSGNQEKEIEDVMFPVYPREYSICKLGPEKKCESQFPGVVIYENKKMIEKHDEIYLMNENLDFDTFNNLVPLNKIRVISDTFVDGGYSVLMFREKLASFDIYCDGKYIIPLNIKTYSNILSFEFLEKYYINLLEGKTSENYMSESLLVNELLLPYDDKNYEFSIQIKDSFSCFETIIVDFNVYTKGDLVGICKFSKYCIRRNYL